MTPVDGKMAMGNKAGLAHATNFLAEIGPAARTIADLPPHKRAEVGPRLERAIKPFMQEDGLVLQGSVWVVEAQKV
jgi:hypothetical protein